MSILDEADYEAIRKAIDTRLTENTLNDTIIALPIYVGEGTADLLEYVPDAEDRTDPDEIQALKNSAIYFTAARLVGVVVDLTKITTQSKDLNYSKFPWNTDDKVEDLRTKALQALRNVEGVVDPDPSDIDQIRSSRFVMAQGTRFRPRGG